MTAGKWALAVAIWLVAAVVIGVVLGRVMKGGRDGSAD